MLVKIARANLEVVLPTKKKKAPLLLLAVSFRATLPTLGRELVIIWAMLVFPLVLFQLTTPTPKAVVLVTILVRVILPTAPFLAIARSLVVA